MNLELVLRNELAFQTGTRWGATRIGAGSFIIQDDGKCIVPFITLPVSQYFGIYVLVTRVLLLNNKALLFIV